MGNSNDRPGDMDSTKMKWGRSAEKDASPMKTVAKVANGEVECGGHKERTPAPKVGDALDG